MSLILHALTAITCLGLCSCGRRLSIPINDIRNATTIQSSIARVSAFQGTTPSSSNLFGTLAELLFTSIPPTRTVQTTYLLPRSLASSMSGSHPNNGRVSMLRNAPRAVYQRLNKVKSKLRVRFSKDETRLLKLRLKDAEGIYGKDHPFTVVALNEYAMKLDELGRPAEAESLLRAVLERRTRVLGQEHPDTLEALENYTRLLNKLGRYAIAEPLMKGALQVRRQVVGKYSPQTLASLNDYVDILGKLDRSVESEPLRKYVLDRSYQLLGPQHPETARAIRNFAGSGYVKLQKELVAKDAIRAAIPKLTKDEPDWDLFADDFKVIDQAGVELRGLANFILVIQLLQNVRKAFNAQDEIVTQNSHSEYRLFDPLLETQWKINLTLPFAVKDVPLEIEADTVFHFSGDKVDYMKINSMTLDGKPIQLCRKVELEGSFDENLKIIRNWLIDIGQLQIFEGLRVLRGLVPL